MRVPSWFTGKDEHMETRRVLIEGLLASAGEAGLRKERVGHYRRCCRVVDEFCVGRGIVGFSREAAEVFTVEQDARLVAGVITRGKYRALTKTAGLLAEFAVMGRVRWAERRSFPPPLDPGLASVLDLFEASLSGLATGSAGSLAGQARRFLAWLDARGRVEVGLVDADDVREYLIEAAAKHQAGMGGVAGGLRRLFRFLNEQGLCALNVAPMLAPVAPGRQRALPGFTHEEASRLLGAIDTASVRGKRDYAMTLLALETGLRGCDIAGLRLDEIDWRRDEIQIVQKKTGEPLTLPLSPGAGNAIADWVLNARPDSDAPEVFTRVFAPFRGLAGSPGKAVMARWLGASGIGHEPFDGKSFHGLRRSTGTWLVESGAEVTLASQVLGHNDLNSAKRYIRLADERLRECCLALTGLETMVEALR